ncbi:carboxymuconolactone decarboxylase family protein [Coralloluteibacterium thermophilus]|uniref:Alkyl hydroperoxide reductase AhpD n=1 Tax=Coralloluteibacterium thermophilum TaxID=2707049 RepID=A0ABV9NRK1_9GAMM
MTPSEIAARLPDYAQDLRRNFEQVLAEAGSPGLDRRQIAAVALASGIAARYTGLSRALDAFAADVLDERERCGVRAAAGTMGMTNIYYRFTHLVSNREYAEMRFGLRTSVLQSPGIDRVSFELAALAVSAINGCGICVDAHERGLREHGMPIEGIQSAVRIAAVVHAVAVILEQCVDAGQDPHAGAGLQ